MKPLVVLVCLSMVACVGDVFTPSDGGAPDALGKVPVDSSTDVVDDASDAAPSADAAPEVGPDAVAPDAGCSTVPGKNACSDALDAYCMRHIACWGSFPNTAACRTWLNMNQPTYDCGAPKYNKNVCLGGATTCKLDLQSAPCGVVYNNYPATVTADCGSFFNQF